MPFAALLVLLLGQNATPIEATRRDAIDGVVVDPQGKPVAGAETFLVGGAAAAGGARIRGRSRTDQQGRFRVELEAEFLGEVVPVNTLLATKPGLGVGGGYFPNASAWIRPPGEPARIVLRPAETRRYRVMGPDGKPVAGARVTIVSVIHPGPLPFGLCMLPREWADSFAVDTDGDGRADVKVPSTLGYVGLRVASVPFGVQMVRSDSGNAGMATLRLSPVGRLSGRILADDPKATRGVKISGMTTSAMNSGRDEASGHFEATTDETGRFEVPALTRGQILLISRTADFSSPYSLSRPRNLLIEAGRTSEVELSLSRRIRTRGIAREKATGRPIAGLILQLLGFGAGRGTREGQRVRTDRQGRFTIYTAPGDVDVQAVWPSDFVRPANVPAVALTVPSGVSEAELPPIEFVRAGRVRGVVADDDGKPVAGASVTLTVGETGEKTLLPGRADGTTNARGEFLVDGLPPDLDVWLSATAGEACTGPLAAVRADDTTSYTLRISRENMRSLGGRVLDEFGRPLAGASVRISSRPRRPGSATPVRAPPSVNPKEVRTDAQGRFESRMPKGYECLASVSLAGRRSSVTSWFAATTPSLFDIVLYPIAPADQRALYQAYDAGWAAYMKGEYAEAERQCRAAVDEATHRNLQDPGVPVWLNALGQVLNARGKYAEAEDVFRRSLASCEALLGPEHPDVARILGLIGLACDQQQKFAEAEGLHHRALALCEKVQGTDYPQYAWNLYLLGQHDAMSGKPAEALPLLQQSLAIRDAAWGPGDPVVADTLTLMGWVDVNLERFDAAEPLLRRALAIREKVLGINHALVAVTLDTLATLLRKTGRDAEAELTEARIKAIRAPKGPT